MVKGNKARSDAKKPTLGTRERPAAETEVGNGGGGSTKSQPKRRCWTPVLEDVTSAGRRVKSGTTINGARSGARIMVLAGGVLGYVPENKSRQMLTALNQGDSLIGEVVSEYNTDSELKVRLCVN